MTQFEFISVAVSIVLALSAARLLAALPHLLAPGRRYWLHATWSVLLLPSHLGFWWAIWSYRNVDLWTFGAFAAVMLTPALLFLVVNALVTDTPSAVASWREHFHARRRVFFSLYLAAMVSIPLRQLAVLGDAMAPIFEGGVRIVWPIVLMIALPLVGILSGDERVQGLLVLAALGLGIVNFGAL